MYGGHALKKIASVKDEATWVFQYASLKWWLHSSQV
jgi:hypothetical protein